MGMPEKPQNGMNIAPDGTIYEILEDGSIKRIGKVASNGEFEPFGGTKEGIRVRDGFIYRVIHGKEQKIGRVLPNGEIESISQKIKSETEISRNKVKIVTIVCCLIAFLATVGAGVYIFKEEQRAREAKIAEQERKKDEEYENKIKPVYADYLNYLEKSSPKVEKLDSYIKQLNNLLELQDLKYDENKDEVNKIVTKIEGKKEEILLEEKKKAAAKKAKQDAEAKQAEEERKKQEAEAETAKKAEEERRQREAAAKKAKQEAYLKGRKIGGLIWSDRSSKEMNWNAAKRYCDTLSEGGYRDWRLPNIDELKTFIGNGKGGNGGLWSSTILFDNPELAWNVSLRDGDKYFNYKSNDFHVRCVR